MNTLNGCNGDPLECARRARSRCGSPVGTVQRVSSLPDAPTVAPNGQGRPPPTPREGARMSCLPTDNLPPRPATAMPRRRGRPLQLRRGRPRPSRAAAPGLHQAPVRQPPLATTPGSAGLPDTTGPGASHRVASTGDPAEPGSATAALRPRSANGGCPVTGDSPQ